MDETVDGDDVDDTVAEPIDDSLDEELLDDSQKELYDRAKKFCDGEYKGDQDALQEAMDGAVATVMLDDETASKLTDRVLKDFLEILFDDGASYVPADTDLYLTPALNQLNDKMMEIFGLAENASGEEDILKDLSAEDKQTLYDDTMVFFESLYGESVKSYDEVVDSVKEEAGESSEEEYYEEGTDEYTEETYSEEVPAE